MNFLYTYSKTEMSRPEEMMIPSEPLDGSIIGGNSTVLRSKGFYFKHG